MLDYAGVRATALSAPQRQQLARLIALYIDNRDDGHARIKMDDRRHPHQRYASARTLESPRLKIRDRLTDPMAAVRNVGLHVRKGIPRILILAQKQSTKFVDNYVHNL